METLKVIFVEDSSDDIGLMKRELKKGDLEVEARVVCTQEAFEAELEKPADVVICDYAMPTFDAVTALEVFNKKNIEIPFIIASGTIQEELAVECMRNGASDYLLKDRMTRLPEAVRQAIEKVSLRKKERLAREKAERLYKEVQAASQLKDEFLATLSHELRTHLAVIMGWADLLRQDQSAGLDREAAIETIYRSSREQLRIVDEVLDMSQIIFKKLRLNLKFTDVVETIRRVTAGLLPQAEKKGVGIQVKVDNSVEFVNCDPTRFEQAIRNLVGNAVKFNKPGGKVNVFAEIEGGELVVTVSDTGEGMEAKFLPHIFDRFRQEDTSNTRRHGGLGLGLAITQSLVCLHDGHIEVSSEGKDKGATFKVFFPIGGPRSSRQPVVVGGSSVYGADSFNNSQ